MQQIVADILAYHDGGGGDDDDGGDDGGGGITQEEYLVWTVKHQLSSGFLQLLFQVAFVLGQPGAVVCKVQRKRASLGPRTH